MSQNTLFNEPISLERQIACVEREISMRQRVYPNWVANRKMTEAKANEEIAVMQEVLKTLQELQIMQEAVR
jgi:hypothetical protein